MCEWERVDRVCARECVAVCVLECKYWGFCKCLCVYVVGCWMPDFARAIVLGWKSVVFGSRYGSPVNVCDSVHEH